ncbi:senescence-associated gene 21 [Striga hermonthica]|uniref:Senescence-associated gene 21 n=1 Tax=Striga hermonthica TaxID=68872 RepID=A0A9N7N7E0_STRHE|nr:senescence-associated gene 21 [Striga hermonthica]
MARFFIAKELSAVLTRRGFATASQGVGSGAARNGAPTVMLKKGSDEPRKISWVPDPVTGYYRPENQSNEIGPAELREMLINNNKTRGQ